MRCPKCNSRNIRVVNTYSAGKAGTTQRRKCDDCEAIITTAVVVFGTDLPRGRGARALAKMMGKKNARLNLDD